MAAAGGGGILENLGPDFLPEGLITLATEYGFGAMWGPGDQGVSFERLPVGYCFHVRCDSPRNYFTRFQIDKKQLSSYYIDALKDSLNPSFDWDGYLAGLELLARDYGRMRPNDQIHRFLSLKAARWVESVILKGPDLNWELVAYVQGPDLKKEAGSTAAREATAKQSAVFAAAREAAAKRNKDKIVSKIRASQAAASGPSSSSASVAPHQQPAKPSPPAPAAPQQPRAKPSPPERATPIYLSDAEALRVRHEREAEEEGRKMRHQAKEAAREAERIRQRNAEYGAQEMARREQAEKRRQARAAELAALTAPTRVGGARRGREDDKEAQGGGGQRQRRK
jgi:hypothetical protein